VGVPGILIVWFVIATMLTLSRLALRRVGQQAREEARSYRPAARRAPFGAPGASPPDEPVASGRVKRRGAVAGSGETPGDGQVAPDSPASLPTEPGDQVGVELTFVPGNVLFGIVMSEVLGRPKSAFAPRRLRPVGR